MIISYSASPSRIIVSLRTLRQIIENLKKKGERKERSFRENRKKEIVFRSNAINSVFKTFTWMYKPKKICAMGEFDQNEDTFSVYIYELEY